MTDETITRAKNGCDRVTIRNVADWQEIRAQHDQFAKHPSHNILHLLKCLGPISAVVEHRDHREAEPEIDEKRAADLVIHAIWLIESLGFDAPSVVANRMWDIGIRPNRAEMRPEERGAAT